MMTEDQIQIPEGWVECELAEVIIEKPKSTIKVSEAGNFGEYPFFTSGENILLHDKSIIRGRNLFLATGGIANIKYFNGAAAYSTDTFVVSTNEKAKAHYLYYYLLSKVSYIDKNYFEGSGLKHLQKKDFRKHTFILPTSTTEQQKIASILSKLDEAILQTEQLIEKYKQVKVGLMHDLLTRGIDENGNVRSEETHKFKDSPLGRIPVEWEVVKLKHFGSKGSPYLKTGPFGSSLKTEHWKEIGIPVITIGALGDNDFIIKNLLYISETKANDLGSYKLQNGDILFSRVADVGRSLVIKPNNEGWIMSSNFMRLRLNQNMVIPDFLYLILKNSSVFKKQIIESINENGRSVTNSKILNEFNFVFVPYDEQKHIVRIKNQIDLHINTIEMQLSKLKLQKSGLMHDLLTGKVRVDYFEKQKEITPKVNTIPLNPKDHNQHIEDAVLIAAIVNAFYSDRYPLGRKKVQKLLYLVRRHQEANVACFKKKAAGPYADEVRYKGGEPIAKANKYIATKTSTAGTVFLKGENIEKALAYIEKWEMQSDIDWLVAQFKYTKVDQLELIATIDMACCDLEKVNSPVSLSTVKHLIATNEEWKKKLEKSYFDDFSIQKGIDESYKLFG